MKRTIFLISIFLFLFSYAKSQEFVFTPLNVLHGLSDNQVRYMLQLPDGRMVFKTTGNINIYDGAGFKYIHRDSQRKYPLKTYDGFYRIYLSGDSILWIKDYKELLRVDLRKEKYTQDLAGYFKKIGFPKPIDNFFMDTKQRLWLLIGDKLVLSDHTQEFELLQDQGRLQDVSTHEEKLYLFYSTGKVICYDLSSKRKLYSAAAYPDTHYARFGNTSLVVKGRNGFYQLRNGTHGGFFFFDLQKQAWRKILETEYTLNTLVVDAKGKASISCAKGIWIIDCFSSEKRYWPLLNKTDGSKLNTEISTLLYDKQGGFWLGTVNQGILYDHPERYIFKHIGASYFPGALLGDIMVKAFSEDVSGNIYLKCKSGFYRYKTALSNGNALEKIDVFSIPPPVRHKLEYPQMLMDYNIDHTAELIDSRGWKWIGTGDGLRLFKPSGEQHVFYTKDRLSNNFIQAILKDSHNNIWITTSYGINKVQIDSISGNVHFTSFDSNAGTLDGEYTNQAVYESLSGDLYFGGINGFSILKPSRLLQRKLPFKPVFTNLFLKGEKVEPGKSYGNRVILINSAPYIKRIQLDYNQNFLTFQFSALNYQNPSQTFYRYQLIGIDRSWRETFSRREDGVNGHGVLEISYTNLPHGNYKLRVMASNNNKEWSGPVSELDLTINAPWWQTLPAIICFVVLASVLISAAIFAYISHTRKSLERTHREELLLLRIRNLIDQQNVLLAEKENLPAAVEERSDASEFKTGLNQAESEFLERAMKLVEMNIEVTDYSVEQLSRDLNMDRTGLYRKLITLLDKSPSLFIRNVRLEKAAQLILEGKLNISEITERVGFSSSSYLGKCFYERYGCRPSEYARKVKNQRH